MANEQPTMTLYVCGEVVPPGFLGPDFERMTLDHVKQQMPHYVPTTYEASKAYLSEERKKPKGERDLLREMCVIIPLSLPKDREAYFIMKQTKVVAPLPRDGSMVFCPTIELPPDSFGTPECKGFLKSDVLVFNPPTDTPLKGWVLLSYFTKSGPDPPLSSKPIELDVNFDAAY